MRHVIETIIRVYQRTLSPDHGWFKVFFPNGYCRFHPSCSEYTRQAVVEYGTIHGLSLATRRLLRCNPWSAGGTDPIPTTRL